MSEFDVDENVEQEQEKNEIKQENVEQEQEENDVKQENVEQEQEANEKQERKYNLPEKGPKNYGIKLNPEEEALESINKEILGDPDYDEVENLEQQLRSFKAKFLEFERDKEGNIDMFGLSRMLEKLGQPKTHLEMKKMIKEIDKTKKGTICYRDFVTMMIGPKTSVLKLILMFEEKKKEKERPKGVAPKRDLASLP